MSEIKDFITWNSSGREIDAAFKNAKIRIGNGEYARDKRLDLQQRTNKIAFGYIGEYGFYKWCLKNSVNIEYLGRSVGSGPDHGDFKTNNDLVIDVKTQDNKYIPKVDWRCEVTAEQIGRPADIYVFCKLRRYNQHYTLYIVGWEYEKTFKTNAIYREAGETLRGKPVHYPKWDITISELKPIGDIIKEIR